MMMNLVNPFIIAPAYLANASDFDGANDYLARGADLTGIANSKRGIFSCWFRLDGGDGSLMAFYGEPDGANKIQRLASNAVRFTLYDVAHGTIILQMETANSYTSGASWHNLLASWDLSTGAEHLYIDGVSDKVSTTNTNDTIGYSSTNHTIGANGSTFGDKFNGCLSEYYFNMGEYLDFSDAGNRAKFLTGATKPVNLGTDGSTPTGTSPIVYLKNAAASFGTNSGTGGNLTITGTLDVASTSPRD
jgi:hypothetical protein